MATAEQDAAAKKAAEEAAAKEAAAKKAAEEAEAKKKQSFVARFSIVDGGKTYAPGETVKLTREQFDTLKPLGAIDGDWK